MSDRTMNDIMNAFTKPDADLTSITRDGNDNPTQFVYTEFGYTVTIDITYDGSGKVATVNTTTVDADGNEV